MTTPLSIKRFLRLSVPYGKYLDARYSSRFKIKRPFEVNGQKSFWGASDVGNAKQYNNSIVHTEQRILGKELTSKT